jgi:hypothetical protein
VRLKDPLRDSAKEDFTDICYDQNVKNKKQRIVKEAKKN